MIEEILIENGLTEKEAKLYISTLEAGEISLSRVAERAHLKRSTVYSLTESLKKKGLIHMTQKKGLQYISALSPHLLVERFQNSAELAKSILPQLIELGYKSPIKPRIQFFEGIDGIKQILFDAACSKNDYMGFIDYELMPKEVYAYIRKKVAPEREKRKTHLRLLMPRNKTNEIVLKEYRQKVEHKTIDFPRNENHIEILLYGEEKIGFMSYVKNEMFGVVIDSKAIYQTLASIFEILWKSTK